jgi:hypothetical protein
MRCPIMGHPIDINEINGLISRIYQFFTICAAWRVQTHGLERGEGRGEITITCKAPLIRQPQTQRAILGLGI